MMDEPNLLGVPICQLSKPDQAQIEEFERLFESAKLETLSDIE
jgi:hypothetical protein